ncbi:rhodanese-like domain-containing protein [Campylobacter sp. faydin G-24]|uniref:Rhodanese-like domain-containing protein n=2 Tax=Campylobacter anatolicus TaxID=2829105 RepID=A0ABS5HJZ9_9BACT|nr:rhodanese-like domain-containing protein [Campylobacter anatolicus]MBR8464599.1 rhodanese-like domain-containing protein [Campylobacter anatolicus]MBR8465713.1 rhodanese-like domain-containing protein [Campylobacter anatolicus]
MVLLIAIVANISLAEVSEIAVKPQELSNYKQIVDVRTPKEWAETGVIDGAKLVTLSENKDEFIAKLKEVGVNINEPVAFICRSGKRSAKAANLIDNGNTKYINLKGGMSQLIKDGYQTKPYSEK